MWKTLFDSRKIAIEAISLGRGLRSSITIA